MPKSTWTNKVLECAYMGKHIGVGGTTAQYSNNFQNGINVNIIQIEAINH